MDRFCLFYPKADVLSYFLLLGHRVKQNYGAQKERRAHAAQNAHSLAAERQPRMMAATSMRKRLLI